MKKCFLTLVAIALMGMANAQNLGNSDSKHVLGRFLSYVKIESQSVDDPNPESFPMTEGQMQIANYIFNELKTIDKGNVADIKMSPDYYIYVKVPSNIENEVSELN